jgi:hypothetical protein
MIVIFLRRREDRRIEMSAMARSARYPHAGVLNLLHVIPVDVVYHPVHQPRRSLLRLGVVGKIQPWFSVGPDVLGIGSVTGTALGAQRGLPLVHQLVNLLSRHGLRKDFQIGRRGFLVMMMLFGRRLLGCGGLGKSGNGKQCGNQGRQRGRERRGRELQVQSSSRCGMTSILLTNHDSVWLKFR